MAIQLVKVRAKIEIGNVTAGTPPLGYENQILSFNVDKSRGQIGTFSASLKIKKDQITGGIVNNASVKIWAGTSASYNSNQIFTGIIKSANISPNRDNPEFVILNINGNDILSRLNGKKYTRRCRSSKGVWVSIGGVVREGLRDSKLLYVKGDPYLEMFGGELQQQNNLTTARTPTTVDTEKLSSKGEETQPVLEIEAAEAP